MLTNWDIILLNPELSDRFYMQLKRYFDIYNKNIIGIYKYLNIFGKIQLKI